MYIPQIPTTIAQARALAMKIGDARTNPDLWEVPVEDWLVKANKPETKYRLSNDTKLYDTIYQLAFDKGLKKTHCRQSLKTGNPIVAEHFIQAVLAIDQKIVKILPPINTEAIKIR